MIQFNTIFKKAQKFTAINIKSSVLLFTFFLINSFSYSVEWKKLPNENLYINKVAFDRANPQRLFVAADYIPLDYEATNFDVFNIFGIGGSGMRISEDGGKTFLSGVLLQDKIVLDVVQDKVDYNTWYTSVVENTRGVIYKSTDNGKTWAIDDLKCDATYHPIKLVASKDNLTYHIASINTGLGYSFTTNNFQNCQIQSSLSVSARDLKISEVTDGLMFIAGGSEGKGGVYRSKDNGKTWNKESSGLQNLRVHSVMPSPRYDNLVYCGADTVLSNGTSIGKGYFRSKDGGISWHSFFISGYPVYDIQVHPTEPKYMLAACGTGGLYASKSYGEAWEKVDLPMLQDSSIRRVFIPNLPEGPGEDGGFQAYFEVFNSGLYFSTEYIKPTLVSVDREQIAQDTQLNIYPNPVQNKKFTTELINPSSQQITYTLFDITGLQIFKENTYYPQGIVAKPFDLTQFQLSSGIYILEIELSNTVIREKIILNN